MSYGLTCQTCNLGYRLNQVKQLFSLKSIINLYILKKKDQKRAWGGGGPLNPVLCDWDFFYFTFQMGG